MRKQFAILLVLVVFFNSRSLAASVLYPYGLSNGDATAVPNDDGYTFVSDLDCGFPFIKSKYSSLYLNTNGVVSFNGNIWQWVPGSICPATSSPYPIIAPFWADVDTRHFGTVYYRVSRDSAFITTVTADLKTYFGTTVLKCPISWVFVATWYRVVPYGACSATISNTFQLVLATDGTNSYAMFNYDSINWLWGSASVGSFPQAGYNDLVSTSGCVPVTGTAAMATLPTISNVGLSGRYAYRLTPKGLKCPLCRLTYRIQAFTLYDCNFYECSITELKVKIAFCGGCCCPRSVNTTTHYATFINQMWPYTGVQPIWSPYDDMRDECLCCNAVDWWIKEIPYSIGTADSKIMHTQSILRMYQPTCCHCESCSAINGTQPAVGRKRRSVDPMVDVPTVDKPVIDSCSLPLEERPSAA